MFSQSEQDLTCAVCQDIFKDPVVLSCRHSFCKECLQNWWGQKQRHECPLCKKVAWTSDPPHNLALKNLCDAFLLERDPQASSGFKDICSLHFERVKLFCEDDQQPVCLVCRDSNMHNNHKFRPIDEAAQDHREELHGSLAPLTEKLKLFVTVRGHYDQTADHIKVWAQNTESQIKQQFKKLRQFLQEEEEARISALREEEERRSQSMNMKIEVLNREIAVLTDTVRATEEELRADDVSLLRNYKAAAKRVQQRPLLDDPEPISGALIDKAKHLGNLSFNIWNKMKEMISFMPLILDPNSAHPLLLLSKDLTTVSYGTRQKLPDNPERFDYYDCVLSSESFDSGTHSWDAEVINANLWGIGVVQESVRKKGEILSGCWALRYSEGIYCRCSPPLKDKVLLVKINPQRIRVYLDFDGGKLSFWDADTNSFIHTFKEAFTERLFPYFGTLNSLSLRILPKKISVTVEQPKLPLFSGFLLSFYRP
ncbi:zinc-binding protein A33-like [Cheilinus undulatus]|uniref:zinc-binding protein A33-like n=1 Tax=Cheilinus undulatus TaxID=241271 RepID=UPI001BD509A5|nr:zinc-binding protein A33-like [Cheilinus undulatus]